MIFSGHDAELKESNRSNPFSGIFNNFATYPQQTGKISEKYFPA